MKKMIIFALSSLVLTACSSGVTDVEAVSRAENIKHLCLKGNTQRAPSEFISTLQNALKNKGISSEFVNNSNDKHCETILRFSVKGNDQILAASRLRVDDVKNKKVLGTVSYKRRGDEKNRVAQVGLKGQIDTMINELFNNY